MLNRELILVHYTFRDKLKYSNMYLLPVASGILSYLFELNIENDDFLRSKILKCITKTVQLAQQRVQLHADLADYLPTLSCYTQDERNSERRIEIVRLFHLFLGEASVQFVYLSICIK